MTQNKSSDERPDDVAQALSRGSVRFLGLDFQTAPEVLVPRRETELLVRTSLQLLSPLAGSVAPRIIDVGCGSGNLACTLAANLPRATIWACDLAVAAADLTRRNAEALGVADRVHVAQGDLFAPLTGEPGLAGTVDLVVCNPPYISTGRLAGESSQLLEREPRIAFDGGPFGVAVHQRIVREALAWLRDGGSLAVEVGAGQAGQVERLFARAKGYGPVSASADGTDIARVVFAARLDDGG